MAQPSVHVVWSSVFLLPISWPQPVPLVYFALCKQGNVTQIFMVIYTELHLIFKMFRLTKHFACDCIFFLFFFFCFLVKTYSFSLCVNNFKMLCTYSFHEYYFEASIIFFIIFFYHFITANKCQTINIWWQEFFSET